MFSMFELPHFKSDCTNNLMLIHCAVLPCSVVLNFSFVTCTGAVSVTTHGAIVCSFTWVYWKGLIKGFSVLFATWENNISCVELNCFHSKNKWYISSFNSGPGTFWLWLFKNLIIEDISDYPDSLPLPSLVHLVRLLFQTKFNPPWET